ncbi:hypothetical protein [Lacisediminihabitans sp.]|uniref:hypothetical protein n=1 Tax=Lacisediminihabitans sp. TaxID=2787631 RepID=UPI00374CDDFE
MKIVSYGGESFITSDDAAEALLLFAAAAAINNIAEVIEVPSLRDDGRLITVSLVIGPASELIAFDVDSDFDEPDTSDSVRLLRERAATLGASSHVLHASPFESADSTSEYSDDV